VFSETRQLFSILLLRKFITLSFGSKGCENFQQQKLEMSCMKSSAISSYYSSLSQEVSISAISCFTLLNL